MPRQTSVNVSWRADLDAKRDLLLLSVGISNYAHSELNLPSPRDDARALFAAFAAQAGEGEYFRKLIADPALQSTQNVLVDEQATRPFLMERLNWLSEHSNRQSVVIVTLSGHGLQSKGGRYLFLTHDFDPAGQPAATSMPWDDFLEYFKDMPCPVIVIVDTCHSGAISVDGSISRDPVGDLTRAIDAANSRLNNCKNGIMVLAACLSNEKAKEKAEWGHGALSLAVLEAVGGRRLYERIESAVPLPEGPIVTMENLRRYAEDRVRELVHTDQGVIAKSTEGMYLHNVPVAVRDLK